MLGFSFFGWFWYLLLVGLYGQAPRPYVMGARMRSWMQPMSWEGFSFNGAFHNSAVLLGCFSTCDSLTPVSMWVDAKAPECSFYGSNFDTIKLFTMSIIQPAQFLTWWLSDISRFCQQLWRGFTCGCRFIVIGCRNLFLTGFVHSWRTISVVLIMVLALLTPRRTEKPSRKIHRLLAV